MIRALAIAALPLLVAATTSLAAAQLRRVEGPELALSLGSQYTIPARGVASYSPGPEDVVDIRLVGTPAVFVIVPRRPGVSSLLLLYEDGTRVSYRLRVGDPCGSSLAH